MSELKIIELEREINPKELCIKLAMIGQQVGFECKIETIDDYSIGGAAHTIVGMYEPKTNEEVLRAIVFDSDSNCFYIRDFGKTYSGFDETYEDIFLKTVRNHGLISKVAERIWNKKL